MVLYGLDYAQAGDITVVDGAGYTDRTLVGGMIPAYAEMRGLGGFGVNGAVRDFDIQGVLPISIFPAPIFNKDPIMLTA